MKRFQRILAVILILAMLLPTVATAVETAPRADLVLTDAQGNAQPLDDSWAEDYPYGLFALGKSEMALAEDGTAQTLTVFRLGGTTGKAAAVIAYQPAVAENADGTPNASAAASADDIRVEVEDAQAITQYQAWGEDPAPEAGSLKLLQKEGTDGEGKACIMLYADGEAEAYQWLAKEAGGDWINVEQGTSAELPVGEEDLAKYDFRLVYTLQGADYSTDSLKGEAYVKPQAEEVPPMPEGMNLNPEKTYSALPLEGTSGRLFEITFADGEYQKDIRITGLPDDAAEIEEFATFTIVESVGGDVHTAMNTTVVRVADDDADKSTPAQVGFSVESVRFDKATGKAAVTVERTGGTTQVLTVDWTTKDGTAVSGQDYAEGSGTLRFYGEQTTQTIEIQLINDKEISEQDKTFTVELSNLKGDDASSISRSTVTVALFNTAGQEEMNVVSTLYDVNAVDASASVAPQEQTPVAVGEIGGSQVTQQMDELSAAEQCTVTWGSGDELEAMEVSRGKINFAGGNWTNTVSETVSVKSDGEGTTSNSKTIANMSSRFKSIYARVYGGAEFASGWDRTWYGDKEFGYTYFEYTAAGKKVYSDCEPEFSKSGLKIYLSAWDPFYESGSWNYQKGDGTLKVGVKKIDSQPSDGKINAKAEVTLTRRTFDNNFYLKLFTANDASVVGNTGGAAFATAYYADMVDSVVITEGGQRSGKLYIGSTLQVKMKNSHLVPSSATILDANGYARLAGEISGTTATFSNVDLDPTGTYTLCITFDRKQDVNIDLSTSSEVREDGTYAAGAFAAAEALLRQRNTAGGKLTVGYSTRGGHEFSAIDEGTFAITATQVDGVLNALTNVGNIQWICFNMPEEDIILYNGKAFAGNAKIWLESKDLTTKDMTFYYYAEEFLTAQRPMKVTLDATAVYFDENGNGKIDGHWDSANGIFVLEAVGGVSDTFVGYISGTYEETMFRPVVDGGIVKQYFLRPYYTANPVSLVVPMGHSESERMQVMPNFITGVTHTATYAAMTEQQKSYRTIVSGLTKVDGGAEHYSADDHYKYTAAASAYTYVDIPLGGDMAPAHHVTAAELGQPDNGRFTMGGSEMIAKEGLVYYYKAGAASDLGNVYYTWEPAYKGNLLYPFQQPELIKIPKSLAGEDTPVTKHTETWYQLEDETWTLTAPTGDGAGYKKSETGLYITEMRATAEGVKELNAYLGAYGDNDRYALVVSEQKSTTGDIITSLSGLSALAEDAGSKETVTIGDVDSQPDSSHMRQNESDASSGSGGSNGQGEYEELSADGEPHLFAFSAEAVSLFSIETSEHEISIGIGFPVYSKDNGGGAGSAANTFDDVKENAGRIKDFINEMRKPKGSRSPGSALAGEDLDANNLRSKSIEFSIAIQLGLTFKYNPLDNKFVFAQAALSASFGFEIRLQYRFTPVPIIYVYLQFSAEVEVSTGLGQERLADMGTPIIQNTTQTIYKNPDAQQGQERQYAFLLDKKAFNVTFDGTIGVDFYEFDDNNGNGKLDAGEIGAKAEGFKPGKLSSDGSDSTEAMIKIQNGFDLGKKIVVVMTALTDKVEITELTPIVDVKQKLFWEGFDFNIEVSLELGAGIGVEIAKVEIFVRGSVGIAFCMGGYDSINDEYAVTFDEFSLSATLGFRVVFLFFNYEQELISYSLNYERGDGWSHGWSALGGMFGESSELSLQTQDGIDVTITPPSQVKARAYSNNVTGEQGDMTEQAYNSNTPDFQVSGYGSSVNAFQLVGDVETGYEYQIVTVGEKNYVVYTGTRQTEAAVDNTELWLSRLEETDNVYGLVHPGAGMGANAKNYVTVDGDGTGDLDFYAWPDADGKTIHVTWVSYENATKIPVRPDGTPYGGMTAENYKTIPAVAEPAEVTEPTVVAEPAEVTEPTEVAQPVKTDYVLTKQEYEALAPEVQANYAEEGVFLERYYRNSYASYDDAEAAYNAAEDAYAKYLQDKAAYAKYLQDKDAYDRYLQDKAVYDRYLQDKAVYDSYKAWYDYFIGNDPEEQVIAASRNTVVKHATFDTTAAGEFAGKQVVSDTDDTYFFLPRSAGEATVYAQSVPYNDAQLQTQLEEYGTYLNDVLQVPQNATDPNGYMASTRQFRMNYQRSLYGVYGGNSRLTVSIPGRTLTNNVMYVSKHQADGNGVAANQTSEILTDLTTAKVGSTWYLSYLTQQEVGEKNDSGKYVDRACINRLYLRTFTIDDAGEVTWGEPYLLRSAVNYEESSDRDGLYTAGVKTTGYQDAYISGISFQNGRVGDKLVAQEETFEPFAVNNETFLLFEMNGSTYVVQESSLRTITTQGTGKIAPFFTVEQEYGDRMEEGSTESLSSGKSEVVIGTDGDGNVAAVYTSTVANTGNTAIYIAYWDPELGAWSDGVMLAMNYMDVYERSVANGWTAEETEAAYLDPAKGGGMTQLTFSGLQMALGRRTAMTTLDATTSKDGRVTMEAAGAQTLFGDKLGLTVPEGEMDALADTYSAKEIYEMEQQAVLEGLDVGASTADAPELLILTKGTMSELWEYTVNGEKIIGVKNEAGKETAAHGKVGVYAISYGKGGQQVGNAAIRFAFNKFTSGAELYAAVSLQNVGDAAIRGSVDQPITVRLMANISGTEQELAAWNVTQSIGAGQTVSLRTEDGLCKPLAANMGQGDFFYLTLQESSYASQPYTYDSQSDANLRYVFRVEDMPELGMEKVDAKITGVTQDGKAEVEFTFDATNRGAATAEEVFVQFSYVSGYETDSEGVKTPVYSPLDLTDSVIHVSQQKLLTEELETLGVNDLKNGVIYLGTDSTYYTDRYYISAEKYNSILAGYYSTTEVAGWASGTYEGTRYWYDPLYYISAYAAYKAGQAAVSGWVHDRTSGNYFSAAYETFAAAKAAADAARKAEYILSESGYNALTENAKHNWKQASDGSATVYIPVGYADYAAANAAYKAALQDGGQDIAGSYLRTVEGTVRVAPELFKGDITGSLNLRAEIFCRSSNANVAAGLYSSDHSDEYYADNNTATKQLEQATFVEGASKVVLARGSVHSLPLSIRTTTGKAPQIRVVEVEDGAHELSTLNFVADTDTDGVAGTQTGSITVVGATLGGGIIHVTDLATNTIYPIAYTVAEEGQGINIFNDDAQFRFSNADGSVYDEDALHQSWNFKSISAWTQETAVPYLGNLSVGEKDASFTFDTKASKFSFDLIGSATITSNKFPGTYTISHDGKTSPPTSSVIDFGNDMQVTHTITVTITSDTAYFDTVHLEYAGEYKPSDDTEAPGLYFSRSFPAGSSVQTGESIAFTVWAVDSSGIGELSFNGEPAQNVTVHDNGMWSMDFAVTENTDFAVKAMDTNGNTTYRKIVVDWFGTETTGYGKAPELTVQAVKVLGQTEEPLTADTVINDLEIADGAFVRVDATAANADLSYSEYNKQSASFVRRNGSSEAQLTANGYYLVKADSTDSYGTWSQYLFAMNCIEPTPSIAVSEKQLTAPNAVQMDWVATKDESSTTRLKTVTVNGQELAGGMAALSASCSGTVNAAYGGQYTFEAEDEKGVKGIAARDIKVPVDISEDGIFTTTDAWGQPDSTGVRHGTVTVDFGKVTGGDYVTAQNLKLEEYYGSYEFAVVSAEETANRAMPDSGTLTDGENSWLDALSWTAAAHDEVLTAEGLTAPVDGTAEYFVILRDAQNPQEYSTMAVHKIVIGDNAIEITGLTSRMATLETTSDGRIYVSAKQGATGGYEFAVLPQVKDEAASTEETTVMRAPTAAEFKAAEVVWQTADTDSQGDFITVKDLKPGTYHVAVRALYPAAAQDLADQQAKRTAVTDAKTALAELQQEQEHAAIDMTQQISEAQGEWGKAQTNAKNAETTYEELKAKLESGDITVTNTQVDEAYDAWQQALQTAAQAEAGYKAALTGLDQNTVDNILALRQVWREASSEEEHDAHVAYEKAVAEACRAYEQAQYADRIANAQAALTQAEQALANAETTLQAASAKAYTDTPAYWDGMLISDAVAVRFGTGIKLSAQAFGASGQNEANGSVQAKAEGGTPYIEGGKVYYQYAVTPIAEESDAVDYSTDMTAIGRLGLTWYFADDLSDAEQKGTIENLLPGYYQVFTRVVYDDDPTDDVDPAAVLYTPGSTTDLQTLRKTYENAQEQATGSAVGSRTQQIVKLYDDGKQADPQDLTAFWAAVENDPAVQAAVAALESAAPQDVYTARNNLQVVLHNYVQSKADAAVETARVAYEAKRLEAQQIAEKAYAENPAYYATADFDVIKVPYATGSHETGAIISVKDNGDETVISVVKDKKLTEEDCNRILAENGKKLVRIVSGDRQVLIPKGALTGMQQVADALTFPKGEGNVVRVTRPDGTTVIAPVSVAEDGKILYLYHGEKEYALETRSETFADIAGHWAEGNIVFAANRQIFRGVTETKFQPEGTLTRAMLATVLYRLAGEPAATGAAPFKDVKQGSWYEAAVLWAYNTGVVKGVSDTKFAPDDEVTREQLVTMIHRYLTQAMLGGSERSDLSSYADHAKVNAYAQDAFSWANAAGVVEGTGKGLEPGGNATRAQAAAIMERTIRYILQ